MPNLRPTISLTAKQWRKLLRRQMMRNETRVSGAVKLTGKANLEMTPQTKELTDRVMNTEPQSQEIMAQLFRNKPGVPIMDAVPETEVAAFPWAEAKMKYIDRPYSHQDPYGWQPVKSTAPPAQRLREVPPGSSQDTSGGMGMAYSEMRFQPVVSGLTKRAAQARQSHLQDLRRTRAMGKLDRARKQLGSEVGDLTRPALPAPESVMQSQQEALPSIDEINATTALLEMYWKEMGGGRSVSGRYWANLAKGSRTKYKPDTFDYFIRSGLKFRDDPEKFTKRYPREGKLMTEIWNDIEQRLGE